MLRPFDCYLSPNLLPFWLFNLEAGRPPIRRGTIPQYGKGPLGEKPVVIDMLDTHNARFHRKTLRHFDQMRRQPPDSAAQSQPFPDDWFDIPHDSFADFGAMTYLASLVPFHRDKPLARAQFYLEPPLRLGQYRMFRSNGFPRAFITWAGLSPEAEMAFAVDHQPLAPEDWTSGSSVWLIDFVAPFGQFDQIVAMLSQNTGLTRLRTLWHNKAGDKYRIIQWDRDADTNSINLRSFGVNQFRKLLNEGL